MGPGRSRVPATRTGGAAALRLKGYLSHVAGGPDPGLPTRTVALHMSRPLVRPLEPSDRAEWLRMRSALWPDDHRQEVDRFYAGELGDMAVFVAPRPGGGLRGFAEWGLRPFAEGCRTSPVGYLEGIWTDEDARRSRVATALYRIGADWSRARGCEELASDCALDNLVSYRFHLSLGFEEAERVICFRRDVPSRPYVPSDSGA